MSVNERIKVMLDPVKKEVLQYREKIVEQLVKRKLYGESLVTISSLVIGGGEDAYVEALCKTNINTNNIQLPFFPRRLWEQITNKPLPVIFENYYPATESKFVRFSCSFIKHSFCNVDCTRAPLWTFAPWVNHVQIKHGPVLTQLYDGLNSQANWKTYPVFALPLLLCDFDLFPFDNDPHAPDALNLNRSVLLDTKAEENEWASISNDVDIISKGNLSEIKKHLYLFSRMEYLVSISPLSSSEEEPEEPKWSNKDEVRYRKVLSSIVSG